MAYVSSLCVCITTMRGSYLCVAWPWKLDAVENSGTINNHQCHLQLISPPLAGAVSVHRDRQGSFSRGTHR
eukprot:6174969-Pleurochrysis_carterae.AAC.1